MKLPVRLTFHLRTLTLALQIDETRYTRSVALSVGLRSNLGPKATNERSVWNPGVAVIFMEGAASAYISMRFLRRTWQPFNGERHDGSNASTRYVITPRRFLMACGALR